MCNETKVTPDQSNDSQILFILNNETYYGDRSIIYGSMLFIKDTMDFADFDLAFTLNVNMSKYCVDLYINAMYDKNIDINNIYPLDFYDFVNFIDRYPTTITSIDLLEDQMIYYIEINSIPINDSLTQIISRYGLKNMYLYVHNKKFGTNT